MEQGCKLTHTHLSCLVVVSEANSRKITARTVEVEQAKRERAAETDALLPWLHADRLSL